MEAKIGVVVDTMENYDDWDFVLIDRIKHFFTLKLMPLFFSLFSEGDVAISISYWLVRTQS